MDAETIRILVAALGGVIAGVIAAFVAGVWSRRINRQTIEAARNAAALEHSHQDSSSQTAWRR